MCQSQGGILLHIPPYYCRFLRLYFRELIEMHEEFLLLAGFMTPKFTVFFFFFCLMSHCVLMPVECFDRKAESLMNDANRRIK